MSAQRSIRRRASLRKLLVVAIFAVAAAAEARPKVVVALVVDQLAAWVADQRWPLLPKRGGFARLLDEGTRGTIVYPHAVSDTAPGHAALFTGATPRRSCIFGNEIIDDKTQKRVSILRDKSTKLVTSEGIVDAPSSSLAVLCAPTLADALRAQSPSSTIVSLSLKDRAALFGGGHAPAAALWYDAGRGAFVSSTVVARAFPEFARAAAGREAMQRQLSRVWTLSDEKFVAAHAATPDAQLGEGDLGGFGVVFPHALSRSKEPARAFRASPFADEVLLALATAAVATRDKSAPMLLSVSLSANDYVGHLFGPDSYEAWDELLRLDAALARFLAELDAEVGPKEWALLLAGDHGAARLPETQHGAGRVLPDELAAYLAAAAKAALGDGDFIAGVADPYVYLTTAARALDGERREELHAAITAALLRHDGVAAVFDARTPPASCAGGDAVEALVCRSLVAGQAGEVYVVLRSGWFFDSGIVVGKGSGHGSPYAYDRTVPFVVRAPGQVAAHRQIRAPFSPDAYTATAARFLGVAPPEAARKGRVVGR